MHSMLFICPIFIKSKQCGKIFQRPTKPNPSSHKKKRKKNSNKTEKIKKKTKTTGLPTIDPNSNDIVVEKSGELIELSDVVKHMYSLGYS